MIVKPFRSLLIANRGEIACRITRTARRMGLRVIAVYSEADANARHVTMADEACLIGPGPARDSYLAIDRIIEAANASGAEAVHPGYGFLSEKWEFAEACENAGLVFVGPPASAIRAMGSKSAAKALMQKAGVPIVPGYHGDAQDGATLHREAKRIGWPLLLKAVAGGGGKGMRIVREAGDLDAAVAAASREALAAFGDGRLLIEALIERPRHIEVQIFADTRGCIVSLFERECTLQRRHQKVIEEAPSAALTPERRERLYEAARTAAAAVGYVGAGTVEFVADDQNAYFIEMNTRLQVEHPVTEMITGLDLVEWQLRVAMGEAVPLRQDQIASHGHAVEARVYAEDPLAGFLPSSGGIAHWRQPREEPGLRVDAGYGAGDTVPRYYDAMLAKVVAHAPTRAEALVRLQASLSTFEIAGVPTNIPFLTGLLAHGAVAENAVDTGFIEREAAALAGIPVSSTWHLAAACAAILENEHTARQREPDRLSPWAQGRSWRLSGERRRVLRFQDKTSTAQTMTLIEGRAGYRLVVEGVEAAFQYQPIQGEPARFAITLGALRRTMTAVKEGNRITVFDGPFPILLNHQDPFAVDTVAAAGGDGSIAPMPGTVIALLARAGDTYEAGEPMLILEAMKMEHTLRFPSRGRVTRYLCAEGDFVAEGALLAEIEAAEAT